MNYDCLIIGAGTAGMACAIRAAERGVAVLMIEQSYEVGGTLHVTAGHLSAGGTSIQQKKQIDDDIALHWQDIERISKNSADPIIAKKAVELAPATIEWLAALGYQFHEKAPLVIHGHEPYSIPRTYFGANDYFGGPVMQPGKAVYNTLMPVFEQLVAANKITLLTNHTLTNIYTENNEVQFIEVQNEQATKKIQAKKYLLATGGYAANPQFFAASHPGFRLVSTAKETSTGSGLKAAMQAGAVFHNAEKHIFTLGGIETIPGAGRANFWNAWARVSNSYDRTPREIYINQFGERFMNEHDLTVDERERIVLNQPGQFFYVVFDEAALNAGSCIVMQWNADKFKQEAMKEQCCWGADTIKDLAKKIAVDANKFQQTVQLWNKAVEENKDILFNRSTLDYPVLHPPFYALKVNASCLISFGGIKVNESLQVMHHSGNPIANLYAAGEILGAGTTSGNAFCSGMLLTPALSFGKWLGEQF